jgi:hypothetical protein
VSALQEQAGGVIGDALLGGGFACPRFAQDHESRVALHGLGNVLQGALGWPGLHPALAGGDDQFGEADRNAFDDLAQVHLPSQRNEVGGPVLVILVNGQGEQVGALVSLSGQLVRCAGLEDQFLSIVFDLQGIRLLR